MKKHITINTDGGARGNPGPSAYAFVVKENGKIIYQENGYLGELTNNQSEYIAVVKAMEWLTKNADDIVNCVFILDSELVAKQLSGLYKIKEEKLKNFAITIKTLEKKLSSPVSYTHVKREFNREADALVNKSLDENRFISRLAR